MPTYVISTPPSVNSMYRNVSGVGRVKTSAYKKWQAAELLALMAQRAKPVETPVSISIIRPSKCKADADNTLKGVLDLLVAGGIIVVPVGEGGVQELIVGTKKEGKLIERVLCDVRFVKLVGKYAFEE